MTQVTSNRHHHRPRPDPWSHRFTMEGRAVASTLCAPEPRMEVVAPEGGWGFHERAREVKLAA